MAHEMVLSEITGAVWKIVVSVGDAVDEDDELMILESMKMEIPVLATAAGTVAEILVEEGAPVSEDQELVRIES